MNFANIKNRINEAILNYGYSRTAKELLKLSDRQLADVGISKVLLQSGYRAYPWRERAVTQVIPDNVTDLNTTKTVAQTPIMPRRPKAA